MTNPDRIKSSISRSIYFAKIGAKITETSQQLDLDPFVKILKKEVKAMTRVGVDSPLSILVSIIFRSSAPFVKPIVTELSKIIELYFWARMLILIIFNIIFGRAHSSISTPPRICIRFVVDSTIIIIITSYTVK